MLEEPPLNPPKNGLPKEWVEGTENPELAYLLNFQKILSLQKITASRGRGGGSDSRSGWDLPTPTRRRILGMFAVS